MNPTTSSFTFYTYLELIKIYWQGIKVRDVEDFDIYKDHKDSGTKHFLCHLRTDSFLVSPMMSVKPGIESCMSGNVHHLKKQRTHFVAI